MLKCVKICINIKMMIKNAANKTQKKSELSWIFVYICLLADACYLGLSLDADLRLTAHQVEWQVLGRELDQMRGRKKGKPGTNTSMAPGEKQHTVA